MSLKCPLSTLRIQVPCRSVVCTHNQCFDASSFLELQKQAPTWLCPICSKSTSFESLQVDQYVEEILRVTEAEEEQVVVQPDGEWSTAERPGGVTPGTDDDDDDDDLIQISEPIVSAVKQEALPTSIMLQRTPVQSRETSTPSSAARMSSKKRPASQVIDLTASDEEEDDLPVHLPKRPALAFPVRGTSSQESYHPVTGSSLNTSFYPSS